MIKSCKTNYLVYKLSFSNGKEYIGVTMDLKRRLRVHKQRDFFVGRAWAKHGDPSIQTLAVCEEDYAYDLERKTVIVFKTLYPNGYNLVDGGRKGQKPSAVTRQKLSEAAKKQLRGPRSDETRRRISDTLKGRSFSEEHRKKLSEANRGQGAGRKLSLETRVKISAAHRGKSHGPMSEEQKKKLSEAHKGKPLSKYHKQRISEGLKKRCISPV